LGGKAGVDYEIGLRVHKSQLAWINGPFPAATHDIEVFRRGLKEKVPVGKRVIGDAGYTGEPDLISTQNDFDPREIAEFKERVLSRHETFNARIKNYNCLTTKFRHGVENHKVAFEAVCVIVMYEIDNGSQSPLLDPYP
jgi:hypothetical protein